VSSAAATRWASVHPNPRRCDGDSPQRVAGIPQRDHDWRQRFAGIRPRDSGIRLPFVDSPQPSAGIGPRDNDTLRRIAVTPLAREVVDHGAAPSTPSSISPPSRPGRFKVYVMVSPHEISEGQFEEWIGYMGKRPPRELPRAAAIHEVAR
jgi:hypothetical protein